MGWSSGRRLYPTQSMPVTGGGYVVAPQRLTRHSDRLPSIRIVDDIVKGAIRPPARPKRCIGLNTVIGDPLGRNLSHATTTIPYIGILFGRAPATTRNTGAPLSPPLEIAVISS
jgi:hypothetical protein